MKRHKIADLKRSILESSVTRENILCLLESQLPPEPYVTGYWKGTSIDLPDGVELKTALGMKMMGKGLPVKVYNKDGEYTAFQVTASGEYPIQLTYVLNESIERVTDIVVFD
jgi:hypothetical protein